MPDLIENQLKWRQVPFERKTETNGIYYKNKKEMILYVIILLIIAGITWSNPALFRARLIRTGLRLAFLAGYLFEMLKP